MGKKVVIRSKKSLQVRQLIVQKSLHRPSAIVQFPSCSNLFLYKTIVNHTFALWHNLDSGFMKEVDQLISSIEHKIRKLVDQQKVSETENKMLKQNVEKLNNIIKQQENTIKQLEEKNSLSTITESPETSQGGVEVKNKIDGLVQEIDRCIDLLNS
ncbi:MAG: hypothetical protein NT175_02415 [Bacteroidetes bacterium]|nr:hypothetical protein [Bacteroidota bacterium]